ncbi:MAG TPA: hypothetical protein PLX89_12335 [Verrucomicrobiota bacterium]|nr:hypothetical protein [Verrucomicrobiales bacterium]HRI13780.1 hypothetical protein [Verrucomicrobiota bacterium]
MRLLLHLRSSRRAAAFTMVELALCIAIVAFAMVAILGVLPLGLTVQKQNREETIVDQDAPQWVDLIRRGGIGWDDLTNYVDFILVERTPVNGRGNTVTYGFRGPFYPVTEPLPAPDVILGTGLDIVSLLSIPRFEADQGILYSNKITAVCRSFSGAFNSQVRPDGTVGFRPDDRQLDDAFRYQMQVELTPVTQLPTFNVSSTNLVSLANVNLGGYLNALRLDTNLVQDLKGPAEMRPDRDFLMATLYDLRLVFRWPVFRVGGQLTVGPGTRTIRAQLFGRPRFAAYNPANQQSVYWPGTSIRPRRFDGNTITRDPTR